MNQEQRDLCQLILDTLRKRPVFQIFWSFEDSGLAPDYRIPISFEIIYQKLECGLYPTQFDFVTDCRTLFAQVARESKNSVRHAAGRFLQSEFETLVSELSPLQGPSAMKLQKFMHKLTDFASHVKPAVRQRIVVKPGAEPAAERLRNAATDDETAESIAEDIKSISSPVLLMNVIAFIYSIQPEAIHIDEEEIKISSMLIDPENLTKIRQYLNTLMEKAARGEIDPSAQHPVEVLKL